MQTLKAGAAGHIANNGVGGDVNGGGSARRVGLQTLESGGHRVGQMVNSRPRVGK